MFWSKRHNTNLLFPILAVCIALALVAGLMIAVSRAKVQGGVASSAQSASRSETQGDVVAAYRQAIEEIATTVVDASIPINQSLVQAEQDLLVARAPVGVLDRHFAAYIVVNRFLNDPSVDPAFVRHTLLQLFQDLLAQL